MIPVSARDPQCSGFYLSSVLSHAKTLLPESGLRLLLVPQQPITRFVSEYSSLLSSGQQLSMRDSDYKRCFGRSKCGIGDLCNPSSLGTAFLLPKDAPL